MRHIPLYVRVLTEKSEAISQVASVLYNRHCLASKNDAGTFHISLDQVVVEVYTASSEGPHGKIRGTLSRSRRHNSTVYQVLLSMQARR